MVDKNVGKLRNKHTQTTIAEDLAELEGKIAQMKWVQGFEDALSDLTEEVRLGSLWQYAQRDYEPLPTLHLDYVGSAKTEGEAAEFFAKLTDRFKWERGPNTPYSMSGEFAPNFKYKGGATFDGEPFQLELITRFPSNGLRIERHTAQTFESHYRLTR